jgi:hypothetical protein
MCPNKNLRLEQPFPPIASTKKAAYERRPIFLTRFYKVEYAVTNPLGQGTGLLFGSVQEPPPQAPSIGLTVGKGEVVPLPESVSPVTKKLPIVDTAMLPAS